jgi:hypothetical protein
MPQLQPPAHVLPHQQGHRPSLSQLPSMPGSMPGPSPVNPALQSMAHPMVLFTDTLSIFRSDSLILDL